STRRATRRAPPCWPWRWPTIPRGRSHEAEFARAFRADEPRVIPSARGIQMILFLDNYDSFTYNLVQYLGEMNPDLRVVRNDKITVDEALALKPTHIVVSPGPCTPQEAGISMDLIKAVPTSIPLLGVCLGHQAIG